MNPRLLPGLVVVRRDDRHLQIGLEPSRRVVVPDVPEVRRLLDDLAEGRALGGLQPTAATTLARLEAAALLAAPEPPHLPAVTVTGPRALSEALTPHLRGHGFAIGTAEAAGEQSSGPITVLLAHRALPRELTDPLVRDGIVHLVAVATPWGWDLGPFVVPGETACLRCVDAAYRELDPRHGVIVDQLARPGTTPVRMPSVDGPLLTVALGWMARDLLAYARGHRPSTWSSTVHLADVPSGEVVSERRWLRHPHCGCAWDALAG